MKKLIFLLCLIALNAYSAQPDRYEYEIMIRPSYKPILPIIAALQCKKYEDFDRLLKDPTTNINILPAADELSPLHALYYRTDQPEQLERFKTLLRRPDLQVDQKGSGRGDFGSTVLGIAISFILKGFENYCPLDDAYYSPNKINQHLEIVDLLLKHGAALENMYEETQEILKQRLQVGILEPEKIIDQLRHKSFELKINARQSIAPQRSEANQAMLEAGAQTNNSNLPLDIGAMINAMLRQKSSLKRGRAVETIQKIDTKNGTLGL